MTTQPCERVAPRREIVISRLDYAQHLIEIGWCQKASSVNGEHGQRYYCALGALAKACSTLRILADDDEPEQIVAGADIFTAAYQALRANLPDGYTSVAEYNDTATQKDVIRLFLHAKNTVAVTGVR